MALSSSNRVTLVSPDELNALLDRVHAESWQELVLVGPGAYKRPNADNWPEVWGIADLIFQHFEVNDALIAKLQTLTRLSSLKLIGSNIGDDGARAIATSLSGLTSLNLWDNGIGRAGASAIASNLKCLSSLVLGFNNIGTDGAKEVARLTGLRSLDLQLNNIEADGAKAIARLNEIKSLSLGRNNLGSEGAKALASLTNLDSLDLADNRIGADGANALVALEGLTSLNLAGNNIGEIGTKTLAGALLGLSSLNLAGNNVGNEGSQAIARSLKSLTSLNLADNTIGAQGAQAIAASLKFLNLINLSSNNVGVGGAQAIAALTSLKSLNLAYNSIGAEGARTIANGLAELSSLNIAYNGIGTVGAKAIATLTELTSLNLADNAIRAAGAEAIATLTGLISLDLSGNNIGPAGAKALLDVWSSEPGRSRKRYLNLMANGDLGGPFPKEILETTDAQAILATYHSFSVARQTATLRPLNELKLLVVGHEAVGKTSLLRYLVAGEPCNPSEARTPGIHHEKIEVQGWSPQNTQVQLNIWDFGGQEMLRGTHRFFLTERSLYLLILDDRRPDDHRSIYEWLKTIRNRGGDSPTIVVINKSDGGKQDLRLDEKGLQEGQPNIIAFTRTSCVPGIWAEESIKKLRTLIVDTFTADERLKHVRDEIPENWLLVKNRVKELARQYSVLSHGDFVSLCKNPGPGAEPVNDQNEQRSLLRLLHDLGTIVAYGLERNASAARREINLLDPNWLTGAIYRILDQAGSIAKEGEFLRSDLVDWLDPVSYPPEWHEFILGMMEEPDIGLCFRLPAPNEVRYLLPEALPASSRFYGIWPEDSLRFRFVYNYLPTSLIPRFIVQSHQHLALEKARWRTGAVLEVRDCKALVLADIDKRRVDILVTGPERLRRAALNVILNDLEAVHKLNPEAEPMAAVPLPDRSDVHVSYEHLLMLERKMGSEYPYFVDGSDRLYPVGELLDGVRRGETTRPSRNEISIEPTKQHVVLLVHGIRTQALWQNELRKTLIDAEFRVEPTNYGNFDVARFLFPWQLFAGGIVREITRQVRDALARHKGCDCSIIAHSFGTYVVARMLRDNPDLEFKRVILCGSVVPHKFPFDSKRINSIINEVGTRDFWPVIAKVTTFGYGSTGTHGFRKGFIYDRWHNGKAHSDFLTREFCRDYWLPYLLTGYIAESEKAAEKPPFWLSVVSALQIKFMILLAVMTFYFWNEIVAVIKAPRLRWVYDATILEQNRPTFHFRAVSGVIFTSKPPESASPRSKLERKVAVTL